MRHIRLPLFARVAVILCLSSMIMVSALLLAPLLRSETIWSVAFFPVIIVAMLAEGIAKTVANDSAITAAWRAGWTLIVALVIAWVCTRPTMRDIALHFPELMLTQLVIIVLIAEFFDLRLLERWPARLSELAAGNRLWRIERPIVAVVRNRWNTGVIGRLGHAASPKYRKRSVQHIVDTLRECGFKVKVFEGDIDLLKALRKLIPPNPTTGLPGGLVLNLATGVQGNARFCQVPAMLELAGIAYTGPDPVAQASMLDRYMLLTLLHNTGVPVPRFALISNPSINIGDLRFPLAVRPRCGPEARSITVKDNDELLAAVTEIRESLSQQSVVEERPTGREIRVSLLGNNQLECLPLLERRRSRTDRKTCPASLEDDLASEVRELARKTYIATGCRDYARIDIKIPKGGKKPMVVAVNWDGVLARNGSLAVCAEVAGYSYSQLLLRIVEEAALRYGAKPTRVECCRERTGRNSGSSAEQTGQCKMICRRKPIRTVLPAGILLVAVLLPTAGICAVDTMPPAAPDLKTGTNAGLPVDRYPARWTDSSGLFTERFGQVKFDARDGNRLSALVYRSTHFDERHGPVWFVMHGASRNAERYIATAAPVGRTTRSACYRHLFFPRITIPAVRTTHSASRPGGKQTEVRSNKIAGVSRRTFSMPEIEHIFEAVRRSFDGRQAGYYLFGHSAGAQFTHRLMTFLPNARVLGAVTANAGWYTLPVNAKDDAFTMPYGLRGSPVTDNDMHALFAAPLTVLVGERDTKTPATDDLVRGTPEAMQQGEHRLARGQYYVTTSRARADALDATFAWRTAVVPRARHSAAQMIGSAGHFLFAPNEAPCESSTAKDAQGLVFTEILADPPSGVAGDANADNERDPLADEFVEIVNTGATPVCLSGWALGDASEPERHVFPLGHALEPGRALVVFGGGIPTGHFGGAEVQWAAFDGKLNLSNDGDVLTLQDATGQISTQLSWGNCGGARCADDHVLHDLGIRGSIIPGSAGNWVLHADTSSAAFSPGVRTDGTSW